MGRVCERASERLTNREEDIVVGREQRASEQEREREDRETERHKSLAVCV